MKDQGGRAAAAAVTATAGGAGETVRAHESYVFVGEGTDGRLLRAPGASEFDAASDSFGVITFR